MTFLTISLLGTGTVFYRGENSFSVDLGKEFVKKKSFN